MRQYNIYAEGDPHECELIISEAEKFGEWVKASEVHSLRLACELALRLLENPNAEPEDADLVTEKLRGVLEC